MHMEYLRLCYYYFTPIAANLGLVYVVNEDI